MREGRAYLKPEEVGLAEVEVCEQGRLDKAQSKTKPETNELGILETQFGVRHSCEERS